MTAGVAKLMVAYEVPGDFGLDEALDREIEKAVGQTADGSGSGLGMRDLDWWFKTIDEAEAAAERVRQSFPNVTVGTCWDEYDDMEDANDGT
jgi:hypothetical protein